MDKNNDKNNQTGFKKEIGLFGACSIMFSIIIGSGIFYLGALVMLYAGFSEGLSLCAWILGGLVSLIGGLCFAELGTEIPKSGGYQVFLSTAYHPIAGFIYTFSNLVLSGPAAIATLGLAFFTSFQSAFGLSEVGVKIGAIVLIVIIGFINLRGVKGGTKVANVTTVAKLIPIFIIIVAGCIFGKVKPDLSFTVQSATGGSTFKMLLLAVTASLWAYSGWQLMPSVSEEMKNPAKDIPRVLVISISAIALIYTLFNFAIYRVLPLESITSMIGGGDLYLGTKAASTLFSFGGILVTVCIMFAIFGSINGSMLTVSRSHYAMAEEGHFFKVFAQLNPKYGVPYASIITQTVLGSVFVIFSSLQTLTTLCVFISVVADFMCILAVPVMRKKYPDIERPYKVWAYPVVLPLGIIVFGALVVNSVITSLDALKLALIVPVISVIVYYAFDVYIKKNKNKDKA